MAWLPEKRVCRMYCPVKGCGKELPMPVATNVTLANGSAPNVITCSVEVEPDASKIWEHLFEKHGLVREVPE